MAVNTIYQAWEANQQVTYYHGNFVTAAGPVMGAQEGAAVVAARTGVGTYTLTINTPTGIGSAIDILAVHLTPLTAVLANACGWTVTSVNQATRVITLTAFNDDGGAAVATDPTAGDGVFWTIVTRNSLAQQ